MAEEKVERPEDGARPPFGEARRWDAEVGEQPAGVGRGCGSERPDDVRELVGGEAVEKEVADRGVRLLPSFFPLLGALAIPLVGPALSGIIGAALLNYRQKSEK